MSKQQSLDYIINKNKKNKLFSYNNDEYLLFDKFLKYYFYLIEDDSNDLYYLKYILIYLKAKIIF